MKLTTLVKLNEMKATMVFNDIVVEGDEQSHYRSFSISMVLYLKRNKLGMGGAIELSMDSRLVQNQVLVKLDMKH